GLGPDLELDLAAAGARGHVRRVVDGEPEVARLRRRRLGHRDAQDGAPRGPLVAGLGLGAVLGPPEPLDELGVAPDIRSAGAGAAHPHAEPPVVSSTRTTRAGPQRDLAKARLEQDLRTGGADLRVVAQCARQRSE